MYFKLTLPESFSKLRQISYEEIWDFKIIIILYTYVEPLDMFQFLQG